MFLSEEIIAICKGTMGCKVRKTALEEFFKCSIPTKVISGGNKHFAVSWSVVSSVPQAILDFCEKNNLVVETSSMNEDIFFLPKNTK